jgi:hydrogenase nickel insertion protein HypA
MHEVSAMQSMVRTVLEAMEQAGGVRVVNVQLVVGACGHFTAEATHQHFEVLTAGTPIQGASLTILWVPVQFQCFSCLHSFESSENFEKVTCPRCGSRGLEVGHQDVCYVSAIDVAFEDEVATSTTFKRAVMDEEQGVHIISGALVL